MGGGRGGEGDTTQPALEACAYIRKSSARIKKLSVTSTTGRTGMGIHRKTTITNSMAATVTRSLSFPSFPSFLVATDLRTTTQVSCAGTPDCFHSLCSAARSLLCSAASACSLLLLCSIVGISLLDLPRLQVLTFLPRRGVHFLVL